MTWYLLDSDHVSLHQRRHPALVHRLASAPPDDVFVTIVTVEEQLRGWLAVIRANRCVVRVEGQESMDNGKMVITELCERFLAALIETTREELGNRISGLDEISPGTLMRAARWLAWLRGAVAWLEEKWYEPHVTVSPECELVCEWWIGERKLTVYFSDEHAEFIKVWGPDIETEMDEGDAEDKTGTFTAWQWLTS